MADLAATFAGMHSPNPFWLASGPPTDSGGQILRGFDKGWGGAVWKTIGDPVHNAATHYPTIGWDGRRAIGAGQTEFVSKRPVDVNLHEVAEVRQRFPANPLLVSIAAGEQAAWLDLARRSEDAGASGLELNLGHTVSPDKIGAVTAWVTDVVRIPVLVKLTPEIADIGAAARAAKRAGASGISAIHTVDAVAGLDFDRRRALKPIALHAVERIADDPEIALPVSGIGGVCGWREAAEFLLLGCTTVQVCTAVMRFGYRIVEEMSAGLAAWMDQRGFRTVGELVCAGQKPPRSDPQPPMVARIRREVCIACDLCRIACRDGASGCIHTDESGPRVEAAGCTGCNLCSLVCPVEGAVVLERR